IKRTGWVMISWVLFHEEIQKGAEGQQRFEDWLQCWKFSKQKNRNIIFVVKTLSRWNELPVFDKLKFLDHEWAAEGVMILTFLKQWENQNLGDLQEIIAHFLEVSVGLGHLPHPFVRASDLIAQGEPPGPQLGEKLEAYYQLQITHKIQSKEELLRLININTL
ncbi:MAG: hypothetical protein KDD61_14270, partial [Bdellovibrionales bacterium]|nr:hypothetical protein [Bdellovibrionales bacterium]